MEHWTAARSITTPPHTTSEASPTSGDVAVSQHRRGPWSGSEDIYLMQLVASHGPLNWVRIAQTLGTRTPKQCRERYHQNLKPSLNHDPITPEEGHQIEQLVLEIGKRWAEIARRLQGRSDNAVKNWWNGSQNRRKRHDRRHAAVHAPAASSHAYAQPQTHTHAFLDERCPRAVPYPMMRSDHFALPPSSTRPRSPTVDSHPLQRHVAWGEAPLPSPCSSEPAESDIGSNYTTSPAGSSRVLDQNYIELPPLRTISASGIRGGRLPSLSSLAPQPHHSGSQPRRPSMVIPDQLPTAPSSPLQVQERRSETTPRSRDSRMKLEALLG